MLSRIHFLECGVEQPPFFVAQEPPVAGRLGLLVQPNAEAMERRLVEERRSLRHAPVHRGAERLQDTISTSST
jgi:hypothetical protein